MLREQSQPIQRSPAPERLWCVELSQNFDYCVAGGASGHCFVWDATNGELLNTWPAHYRKASVVRFTHDGAFVVTAGDDAIVNVWSLASLVASPVVGRVRERELAPRWTMSAHTMPITDLQCSRGAAPLVFSASIDRTVKAWDLANNCIVLSLALASSVNCIALSPCESLLFVGLSNGAVRRVHLYGAPLATAGTALLGGGGGAASRTPSLDEPANADRTLGTLTASDVQGTTATSQHSVRSFVGHTKSVTALALNHDG